MKTRLIAVMSSIFYTNELIVNARGWRTDPSDVDKKYPRKQSAVLGEQVHLHWMTSVSFASCACTRYSLAMCWAHERCTWLKSSSCARLNTPFGLAAAMAAITYTANIGVFVCRSVRPAVSVACGVITYVRCETSYPSIYLSFWIGASALHCFALLNVFMRMNNSVHQPEMDLCGAQITMAHRFNLPMCAITSSASSQFIRIAVNARNENNICNNSEKK